MLAFAAVGWDCLDGLVQLLCTVNQAQVETCFRTVDLDDRFVFSNTRHVNGLSTKERTTKMSRRYKAHPIRVVLQDVQ